MILKAFTVASSRHSRRLAAHLLRTDENEIAEVADVRGIGKRPRLADMLESMHRTHEATRGKRGLFHVAINPDREHVHTMTGADWEKTLAAIEAEFGLEKQPRVLVMHHKKQHDGSRARPHIHAVWQIADVERGRQVDDFANSGRRCGRVARELEKVLEHRQLPKRGRWRTYSQAKAQMLKRSGQRPPDVHAEIREAWATTTTGADFAAALKAKGYSLAQGERPCVVTREGDHMALARELGVKAREVAARLKGIELEALEAVKERQKAQAKEKPPRSRTAAQEAANERQRAMAARLAAARAEAERKAPQRVSEPSQPREREQERAEERATPSPALSATQQAAKERALAMARRFAAAREQIIEQEAPTLSRSKPSDQTAEVMQENSATIQGKPSTDQERNEAAAEQFVEGHGTEFVHNAETAAQERQERMRQAFEAAQEGVVRPYEEELRRKYGHELNSFDFDLPQREDEE